MSAGHTQLQWYGFRRDSPIAIQMPSKAQTAPAMHLLAFLVCQVLCYEEVLAEQVQELAGFRWARMDENDACGLCYTSGTTGKPKARSHCLYLGA